MVVRNQFDILLEIGALSPVVSPITLLSQCRIEVRNFEREVLLAKKKKKNAGDDEGNLPRRQPGDLQELFV